MQISLTGVYFSSHKEIFLQISAKILLKKIFILHKNVVSLWSVAIICTPPLTPPQGGE